MTRREERKEKIRQVAARLDDLIDRMEAVLEEYRRQPETAGPGEAPLEEGEETLNDHAR